VFEADEYKERTTRVVEKTLQAEELEHVGTKDYA